MTVHRSSESFANLRVADDLTVTDDLSVSGDASIAGSCDITTDMSVSGEVDADLVITNAGGDSNSYKLQLVGHITSGDESQTAALFVAYGADPYLVVAAPNATGAETNVLHIDHNSIVFATDNTVDIGASGANRPKDLYMTGTATIGTNVVVSGKVDSTGDLETDGVVKVDDTQVVCGQQGAIADIADTTGEDNDGTARAKINDILAALRTHGLIAT